MWIDHCEVSEFHLGREDVVALKLNLNCSTRHIHHKSNNIGCVHEALVAEFLNAAAQFIASAGAFLITDRANSKTQSKLYIKKTQVQADESQTECRNHRSFIRCTTHGLRPQVIQVHRPNASAAALTAHDRELRQNRLNDFRLLLAILLGLKQNSVSYYTCNSDAAF